MKKILLLLFIASQLSSFAQNRSYDKKTEERIDSILISFYPDGFNGNVLVTENDTVTFKQSYGYSDLEKETPLNDSSVFEINSCSKHFTSLAILKLYEMKKISLEDTLRKFFPELPYSGVTIKHMLTHTSGIPPYEWILLDKDTAEVCENKNIIDDFAAYKPKSKFKPGKKFEYCNMNYLLLASIIEKVSGTTYTQFLELQFFKPLKMNNTYVGRIFSRKQAIPNYAFRYTYYQNHYVRPETQKKFRHQVKYDGVLGQSHIHTTAADLVKWDLALRNYSVLSKATMDLVYDPSNCPTAIETYKTVYGYGCYLNNDKNNGKVVWQAGGDDGGHSYIYRFPDANKMVVILSNKTHTDDRDTELAPVVFKGDFFSGKK
jgi:CubicO group peptidase (beta-lactamase class C family)